MSLDDPLSRARDTASQGRGVPGIGPRHWRAVLASVALAALGYLVFSLFAGWHDVVRAGSRIGWGGAAVLLALSALNYALRFLRWQLFLKVLGVPQPWRPSLQIYLAGFALTTTPGKVGEAVRSLFLKQRGTDHADSVAAFVSERLSDLLAVTLLCAFGWNVYPPARPLIVLAIGAIVLLVSVVSRESLIQRWRLALAARSGRLARSAAVVLRLLASTRRCHSPAILAVATALSLVAWFSEALAFWLLLHWLQADASLPYALFTYSFGVLAGALSFMPGGLGGTEAAMTALLIWHGVGEPVAIAATVIIRITTLWFAVAIGVGALLRVLPSLQPKAASAGVVPAEASAT